MIHTGDLHHLIHLAQTDRWRLAWIGDPRQLQAVGRGGMFAEICTTPRSVELDTIHRFTNDWEAAASLQLRDGNPASLDTYEAHDRIRPGHLDEHLTTIADTWIERHRAGETLAITTTRNEHVDAINRRIQDRRADHREIDSTRNTLIADRQVACVGDVIATRRNRRDLTAGDGQPVRNRDLWTITTIGDDGHITATRHGTTSAVELPADYVREHVRLGYAASEPGNQSASITLATAATTSRGLYVALTRGRDENLVLVVTETHDVIEARDTLEMILTSDRSDTPAVAHRRALTTEASTWPARTECPPCPAMAAPTPEMAPLAACLPLNAELRNRRWPRGPMRC